MKKGRWWAVPCAPTLGLGQCPLTFRRVVAVKRPTTNMTTEVDNHHFSLLVHVQHGAFVVLTAVQDLHTVAHLELLHSRASSGGSAGDWSCNTIPQRTHRSARLTAR